MPSGKSLPDIPGWESKIRGNTLVLYSLGSDSSSGISLYINKTKRTIDIGGWYDSTIGISGGEISLDAINSLFKTGKSK